MQGAEERRLRRINNTLQGEATEGNTADDSLMVDQGDRVLLDIQANPLLYSPPKKELLISSTTAAARYQMDAIPGHHTQMDFGTASFQMYLIDATGFCMFSELVGGEAMKYITGFMKAVTVTP